MKIQDIESFRLPANFRGKNKWHVQFWWICQSTLFGMSPQFMYSWRRKLLIIFGAKIGRNVLIRPSARVTYPWNLTIGNNCWVGDDVCLYSLSNIKIGSDVVISQKSYICSATHDHSLSSFDMLGKSVNIEDEVWIATDVFVAPGVTVHHGSVVGARSSVYCDIPSRKIFVGNPAKEVGDRV